MAKVMFNIRPKGAAPTFDQLQARFSLAGDELDADFGVIEVDDGLYTVLVEERAASKLQSTDEWSVEGPFSNPRIEPMGPPQAG